MKIHFLFQYKWITKVVFMKEYVEKLQRTVDTIRDYVYNSSALWTEDIHIDWISKNLYNKTYLQQVSKPVEQGPRSANL